MLEIKFYLLDSPRTGTISNHGGLFMSKKTIRNAAAISIGTLILGIILLLASGANLLTILCLIVCFITGCISYFGALIKAAQLRKMKWFVGILLSGVLGALIFGLIGPETKTTEVPLSAFLYDSYKQTKRTMGFK